MPEPIRDHHTYRTTDVDPHRRDPFLRDRLTERRSSVVAGSLWMVAISLALFFVPLINGLVGGFVGGYKVGSAGRALVAAVLPAVVVGLGLWGLMAVFELPLWGFLAGTAAGIVVLLADVGLFIGALVGGAVSSRR